MWPRHFVQIAAWTKDSSMVNIYQARALGAEPISLPTSCKLKIVILSNILVQQNNPSRTSVGATQGLASFSSVHTTGSTQREGANIDIYDVKSQVMVSDA